jgi:SAM-dependent methyltransferase
MPASPAAAYNQVPYRTLPAGHTHPDRLRTLALLYGIEAAPVERCRVLEVGCGNGGNLIPMAAALPGSRFIGIDIASEPIGAARARASTLGLENVHFAGCDLMDVDASLGRFDYVIAHGLYSWVPPPVRDKLLEVCRENLEANGVAYISYNTYPGCHQRDLVREMMLYRAEGIEEQAARLEAARGFVDFLARAAPGPAALRDELATVQEREPWAVWHDDLCESYRAVYFHEFAEHARQHGLQFLAEAGFSSMQEDAFPPAVAEEVRRLAGGDRIRKQQYLDFLRCRRFRRSLLCHGGIELPDRPEAAAVRRLFAASAARCSSEAGDVRLPAEEEFRLEDGASMKTRLPFAKAAIRVLAGAWPAAVGFGELLGRMRSLLGEEKPEHDAMLAEFLLRTYASGLVELHALPFPFTVRPGERPRAFALARLQAAEGPSLSTLRQSTAEIEDALARRLVRLLDGTRDRAALLRDLQGSPEAGGMPPISPELLEYNLDRLARLGLLEA